MEVFQDMEFVRLQSMEHNTYLHAGEDGRSVLLDARRASHNVAWAVQQRRSAAGAGSGSGTLYVLLRDAYGQYLGTSNVRYPLSCSCRRANRRCLPCCAGVFVAGGGNLGTTMQWAVEVVPRSFGRPELPIARERWFSAQREIRWVRLDDSGNFSEEDWASFQYTGRHAILLRTMLVHLLGPPLLFFRLMLCVRAGRHGQLSPLVINLPRSWEPLDIVVVRANTGDQWLSYFQA